MKATIKCSNCDSEITNLNMSWGKKQWLWSLLFLPLMLIALIPMLRMYMPKGDFRKDLVVTINEENYGDTLELLGTITNNGKATWKGIELDIEFYEDGKFIDEHQARISPSILPATTENFKVTIHSISSKLDGENVEMQIKVSDARTDLF